MDTDAKGQLGGMEAGKEVRERMAREGGNWRCGVCGKTNTEILKEREDLVGEEGKREEEVVPDELRLAYRDELGKAEKLPDPAKGDSADGPTKSSSTSAAPAVDATTSTPLITPAPAPQPTRTIPAPQPVVQQILRQSPDRSLAWIDTCIYGVGAALVFFILKKFAS